jgi:hypothetical protein
MSGLRVRLGQIKFVVIEGMKTTRCAAVLWNVEDALAPADSSIPLTLFHEVRDGTSRGLPRRQQPDWAIRDKSGKSPRPKPRYPETLLPHNEVIATASHVAAPGPTQTVVVCSRPPNERLQLSSFQRCCELSSLNPPSLPRSGDYSQQHSASLHTVRVAPRQQSRVCVTWLVRQ